MKNVYILCLTTRGGVHNLSIHRTVGGAKKAASRYIGQHPDGPAWTPRGEGMWKSGTNFLLVEALPLEA